MKSPDFQGMVPARAEIVEHLNKVLVLLVRPPDAPVGNVVVVADLVRAHIRAARRALDLFEEAFHA